MGGAGEMCPKYQPLIIAVEIWFKSGSRVPESCRYVQQMYWVCRVRLVAVLYVVEVCAVAALIYQFNFTDCILFLSLATTVYAFCT